MNPYSWIQKRIYSGLKKQIDATGLALFRILFFSVLFVEVIELYRFRHLIYDEIPYIQPFELYFGPAILVWLLVILAIIVGFKTRVAVLLNYAFSLVLIGTIASYEYHMFYAYMTVGFTALFIPLERTLSFDAVIAKFRALAHGGSFDYPRPKVSVLAYFTFLFLGVGLVYFDSIFHKVVSFHWMNGLGVWYPSSIPQIVVNDFTPVLNMKWLMLFLGYLVVAFEAIFIFSFWFKPFRIPFLFIGLGLHIGIYFIYPIPLFAIGVAAFYLLLIPVDFWKKIGRVFSASQQVLIADQPGSQKQQAFLKTVDWRNALRVVSPNEANDTSMLEITDARSFKSALSQCFPGVLLAPLGGKIFHWIFAIDIPSPSRKTRLSTKVMSHGISILAILLVLLQLMSTYRSPGIRELRKSTKIADTPPDRALKAVFKPLYNPAKVFFGFTTHGVFMDTHFQGYEKVITIKHNDTWLPITEESGMPGSYQRGPTWIKWCFRTNGPKIRKRNLKEGIRDYSAFWALRNGVTLDSAAFEIWIKPTEIPTYWEKDFLKNQLNNPWEYAGEVYWNEWQFEMTDELADKLIPVTEKP